MACAMMAVLGWSDLHLAAGPAWREASTKVREVVLFASAGSWKVKLIQRNPARLRGCEARPTRSAGHVFHSMLDTVGWLERNGVTLPKFQFCGNLILFDGSGDGVN